MILPFYKYQGTGNDFIIIDNRSGIADKAFTENRKNKIELICNRRFGIGADGLMLLQDKKNCDFEMIYFNSDGAESSMCGNGGRCIFSFAKRLEIVHETGMFSAIDGLHEAKISATENESIDSVSLKMNDVSLIEKNSDHYFLNTGSPHYVTFVSDVKGIDVFEKGKSIRNNERFAAEGTNVNFVEINNDILKVRTYERGVEDETLSCGTGVTAAALAAAMEQSENRTSYKIETPGGNLTVKFKKTDSGFSDIWLEGPAVFVFKGEIKLPSLEGPGVGK